MTESWLWMSSRATHRQTHRQLIDKGPNAYARKSLTGPGSETSGWTGAGSIGFKDGGMKEGSALASSQGWLLFNTKVGSQANQADNDRDHVRRGGNFSSAVPAGP